LKELAFGESVMNGIDFSIVKRPVISEKSAALAEIAGKYVFEVSSTANRIQIRQVVEAMFKVKIASVRTMNMPGKVRKLAKGELVKPGWKKAICTVKPGYKIDFFRNGNA
jgi:large subunit ribosomal protein L23